MPTPARLDIDQLVQTVRRFNRFYTRQIGVLNEGLLGSPFSLTEVRVLYELAHRDQPTAAELCKELGLDPGYVSRLLSDFEKRGLIQRLPSQADGRQSLLALTRRGQQKFAELDVRSTAEVKAMLSNITLQSDRLRKDFNRRYRRLIDVIRHYRESVVTFEWPLARRELIEDSPK